MGNLLVNITNKGAEGFEIKLGDRVLQPGLNRDLPIGDFPVILSGNFWYYSGEATIEKGKTNVLSITPEAASEVQVIIPAGAAAELSSSKGGKFDLTNSFITVPAGDYQLTVTHDDYETYRQELTAKTGEKLELSPLLAHTDFFLNREKIAQLEAEKTEKLKTRKGLTAGMITSYSVAAAAGIAAGVFEALVTSETAVLESNYSDYKAATLSADVADLRTAVSANIANIDMYRLVRNISLISAGVGIAGGATTMFLRPSIKRLDEQINSLSGGAE